MGSGPVEALRGGTRRIMNQILTTHAPRRAALLEADVSTPLQALSALRIPATGSPALIRRVGRKSPPI